MADRSIVQTAPDMWAVSFQFGVLLLIAICGQLVWQLSIR
jgi:hypothetical protein